MWERAGQVQDKEQECRTCRKEQDRAGQSRTGAGQRAGQSLKVAGQRAGQCRTGRKEQD